MFTRKLNELQINKAIEAINNQSLDYLCIAKNKKGVHMISSKVSQTSGHIMPKSHTSIELLRVIRVIKKAVCEESYHEVYLEFERSSGKLIYQLEMK